MKLYHATTQKKAKLYRQSGAIHSPVRGFTTLDDLLAAQSKLIALAAEMALGKGLPSSFVEDHKWPKTTPVTAIRMVSQEFERMDRTTKDWAYRLRQISNSLTDNCLLAEKAHARR
jgi:hypothetical protein